MSDYSADGVLPMAPDSERGILAALFLDTREPNECFLQCQQRLTVDDFGLHSHRLIYKAMETVVARGGKIDMAPVMEELMAHRQLEAIGGHAYLDTITDKVRNIKLQNLDAYIDLILKYSQQRQLIYLSHAATVEAHQHGEPGDIIARLQEGLVRIQEQVQFSTSSHVKDAMSVTAKRFIERANSDREFLGLDTGLDNLNFYLGGLVEGENIVVAADTGAGKTALALNIVEFNCLNDIPVNYFSLELDRDALLWRLAGKRAGVSQHKLRNPKNLTREDKERMMEQFAEIARWPLWIDDTSGITGGEIYSRGRMQAQKGARLQVVDFLQKSHGPSHLSTRELVNQSSEAVRRLAKDGKTPVLNLSQLSRPEKTVKMTPPRKPNMHDLKESGNIEQDAHVVLLLWREQMIDPTDPHKLIYTGDDRIIIGKNRNGPTAEIIAHFDGKYMEWTEAEPSKRDTQDGKASAAGAV